MSACLYASNKVKTVEQMWQLRFLINHQFKQNPRKTLLIIIIFSEAYQRKVFVFLKTTLMIKMFCYLKKPRDTISALAPSSL